MGTNIFQNDYNMSAGNNHNKIKLKNVFSPFGTLTGMLMHSSIGYNDKHGRVMYVLNSTS